MSDDTPQATKRVTLPIPGVRDPWTYVHDGVRWQHVGFGGSIGPSMSSALDRIVELENRLECAHILRRQQWNRANQAEHQRDQAISTRDQAEHQRDRLRNALEEAARRCGGRAKEMAGIGGGEDGQLRWLARAVGYEQAELIIRDEIRKAEESDSQRKVGDADGRCGDQPERGDRDTPRRADVASGEGEGESTPAAGGGHGSYCVTCGATATGEWGDKAARALAQAEVLLNVELRDHLDMLADNSDEDTEARCRVMIGKIDDFLAGGEHGPTEDAPSEYVGAGDVPTDSALDMCPYLGTQHEPGGQNYCEWCGKAFSANWTKNHNTVYIEDVVAAIEEYDPQSCKISMSDYVVVKCAGDAPTREDGAEGCNPRRLGSPAPCAWTEDSDGVWHTGCGQAHDSAENLHPFCCYCGGSLEAVPYTEPEDDDSTEEQTITSVADYRARMRGTPTLEESLHSEEEQREHAGEERADAMALEDDGRAPRKEYTGPWQEDSTNGLHARDGDAPEGNRMNRQAYERLIAEDLSWLDEQPRTLEREHIRIILAQSPDREYGRSDVGDLASSSPDVYEALFQAEARAEKIKRVAMEALGKYGRHKGDCDARRDILGPGVHCDCGLTRALAKIEET